MMSDEKKTLYERLGGYDSITAVVNDLLPRLRGDPQLGRFWAHRGDDGVKREKQLLIDFLCASAGGPMYYRGRDRKSTRLNSSHPSISYAVFCLKKKIRRRPPGAGPYSLRSAGTVPRPPG